MRIRNVELTNEYILAPMAGVTDLPFRVICSQMGAGMVCMEMISAKALTYKNVKTFDMLKTDPKESVISCQLFGSEPGVMAEAVRMIEDYPFDIIDVNMGCPVPKVVNNGEGSALMKNPKLAGEIIAAMVKATNKPVTAKIRAGFSADDINCVEMAKVLEAAGAAAVAVHGRTREQYYSGKADYSVIADVKRAVSIPVIGNGDVTDSLSAKRLKEETGCDAVMIGRGARGNPWIFKELIGEESERPSTAEIAEMMKYHAKLLIETKGEFIAIREMRTHAAFYTSGLYGSADFRRRVSVCENYEDFAKTVDTLA